MIQDKWKLYTTWLQNRLPQYGRLLNDGATQDQIEELKSHFPFDLPEELYSLYRINNGDQLIESDLFQGTFMGFEFLSISRLLEEYNLLNRIPVQKNQELSQYCNSNPDKVIKKDCVNPKWIPVFVDSSGNCIGIDLDPDEQGVVGQIINFGRDEDRKIQFATSLEGFLDIVLVEVDSGNCDRAIILEEDGGYSYGLRPQSHLIDDLKKIRT